MIASVIGWLGVCQVKQKHSQINEHTHKQAVWKLYATVFYFKTLPFCKSMMCMQKTAPLIAFVGVKKKSHH